jgi:2'-5' RNA ligase
LILDACKRAAVTGDYMRSTILTLAIEQSMQARFDALRQKYYPPALNRIGAHITLFHQLPLTDAVQQELERVASTTRRFTAHVAGLQFLGRGVALKVSGAELLALHGRLSAAFEDVLIAQDRQRFQPHVVVQNKVTPEVARRTSIELEEVSSREDFTCDGIDWWEYLGGPWKHMERFAFSS